ncbi:hypothetical protein CLNEO_25800 [Anaerotignum neopropionicum]|uniref:DUF2812 domain-containing protein n=1 Tax=Anaerotignum neopropionicum TaxID=36847 RepID=A0A136WC57_9FIRM|nr:DUF2812 domain-containing protein [Anaerotignum neopropionicum]KXL52064.1 hypothetical protein CLNEO_25800 [Anaerotignum neopropionicum]
MRKVIYKLFWVSEYDKEEKWLNEMAERGLALVAIGFCKYTFEECIPGEYNVRLELLKNAPSHGESQQYIKFIEETGAEYLGSIMRWIYFRKKTDEGEFNLYSDNSSRIKQMNKILNLIGILCIMNICIGLNNIFIFFTLSSEFNFICGIVSLSLGLFLVYGFFRVYRIKRKLMQEQSLFE